MTLTTTEAIGSYITQFPERLNLDASHEYAIAELIGGTANWVFRITDKTNSTTSVIKHAENYVRRVPSIAFASDRMNYEAQILKTLHQVLPVQEVFSATCLVVVAPARFLAYDRDAKLLHMSDGGEQTLKAAYIAGTAIDMREAGASLGVWIAELHKSTRGLEIGDHQTAKIIYRHNYNNLATALEKYGLDRSLGVRVNEEFGSKLQTDAGEVCHSDFWTGNVLVRDNPLRLTIVDWEMTRNGNGATDVGQFAAEAWLLDTFHGRKGLLEAFLLAYCAAKGDNWDQNFESRQRIFVQFATHIAYWPTRVEWADYAATKKIVQKGYDMLVHALDRDWQWFKTGPLAVLL